MLVTCIKSRGRVVTAEADYIPISLSVCLSVIEHISGTAGPIFTTARTQIPCAGGSFHLWRRCDTLCTSGFMDDVTFGRSGPYGGRCDTGAESDVIRGCSKF